MCKNLQGIAGVNALILPSPRPLSWERSRSAKNYVKMYFEIKKHIQFVSHFRTNEIEVVVNFQQKARGLIAELRQDDRYCETANLLCD